MTALATGRRCGRARPQPARERTGERGRPASDQTPRLFEESTGEPTLDALVSGVWEGLAAHGRATCPLCGGELIAAYGAHALPAEGRCTDCGTTLS